MHATIEVRLAACTRNIIASPSYLKLRNLTWSRETAKQIVQLCSVFVALCTELTSIATIEKVHDTNHITMGM